MNLSLYIYFVASYSTQLRNVSSKSNFKWVFGAELKTFKGSWETGSVFGILVLIES